MSCLWEDDREAWADDEVEAVERVRLSHRAVRSIEQSTQLVSCLIQKSPATDAEPRLLGRRCRC